MNTYAIEAKEKGQRVNHFTLLAQNEGQALNFGAHKAFNMGFTYHAKQLKFNGFVMTKTYNVLSLGTSNTLHEMTQQISKVATAGKVAFDYGYVKAHIAHSASDYLVWDTVNGYIDNPWGVGNEAH